MRLLVTNDDGVYEPGLFHLACALRDAGFDLLIVAPSSQMSGSAASMAAPDDIVRYERVSLPGLDVPTFAVDGPPALCVITAALEAFGEVPTLVASGINPGFNTGRSTLHSGTIGAALTAAAWGMSAVAVSIDVGDPPLWHTASDLAVRVARWLQAAPARTAVNLNVPNCVPADVRGVRVAPLAAVGAMRAGIADHTEGVIKLHLRPNESPVAPNSDSALVREGYATVTLVQPPTAIDDRSVLAAFEGVR